MQRLSQISKFRPAFTPCKQNIQPLSSAPILTSSYLLVSARPFAAGAQPKFGPKLDQHGEPRFLEQVKLFYANAAAKTGISDEKLNKIKACEALVRFNIPLRRDDGSIETITCYR